MLIEQDGLYLWKYASRTQAVPATRRRGRSVEVTQKQAVFFVDIAAPTEFETAGQRRNVLGNLKEMVWDKMKAYVFKFIAGAAVEMAKNHLERNVSRGIVLIKSVDPETWQVLKGIDQVALPTGRTPKIFLFVHGTFSSTVGGFGALGATPWGKSFLETVIKSHDAVIGFNHATLSEDPLQNAQQLLHIFQTVDWPITPQINAVAHSRGGLVLRCLIEKLLPQSTWHPTFNRVVFVASTNGGTLLAEPENWENLVNFYTNLTAGACRVIGLIAPQSKIATVVLNDVVQSIGSFIKYCADSTVTDKLIPGLSAMEPDGDFIKDINCAQTGQLTSEQSEYCIITSEFKPRLAGNHEPKELPIRFLSLLAGKFIGQLMKEANDLVVNTESMGAVDLASGSFIKDRYDFGENAQVYHTNYFTRPEVANALTRWFNLSTVIPDQSGSDQFLRPKRRTRSGRGINTPSVPPPIFPREPLPLDLVLPPNVDTDIVTIDAESPIKPLQAEILKNTPSYVVVRRLHQGTILNYAIEAEDALHVSQTQNELTVINAFDLRESDASTTQDAGTAISVRKHTKGNVTTSRGVILFNNVPVGVVPEKKDLPDAEALARTAQLIVDPKTEEERIIVRRTMPSFAAPRALKTKRIPEVKTDQSEPRSGKRIPDITKLESPPKVTCYFRANMDAEVLVKRTTTIVVTISREMLDRVKNELAETGAGTVRSDKKILVRVINKSKFSIIDESDGQADIDVPSVNEPVELSFDVRATEEGEGEIWILFRQEQISVAKLILKPKVVKNRSVNTEKVTAEQNISDPKPPEKPLHQLWIEESKTDGGFGYKYHINSPDFEIDLKFTSKPILGDRVKYVANLYKQIEDRWISSGRDIENFGEELRAFGATLFDELIPKELQKILWDRRNDFDSMQVNSMEPFIPWELIHLRDPDKRGMPDETIFMAQMGLTRWLDGAGENGGSKNRIKIRNGHVRFVIPKYEHPDYKLPEAEEEEYFLKHEFGAIAVTPESGEVRKIISKPGEFDLLHFACHGVADSGSGNEASLLMQGRVEEGDYIPDSLNATIAANFSNLKADDNNPMVVLNACKAGRGGYNLTGIGGFANAFLMGGAGAFIGTLWSVGDSPARTFTETLYKALKQGNDLSEATIEARNAAKEAGEGTWLAYVVYGHPHLKIDQ